MQACLLLQPLPPSLPYPLPLLLYAVQVKLLDCPGIVFDDSDAGATLLRNCVDAEAMTDPTPAVAAVLKRCAPEQLMQARSHVFVFLLAPVSPSAACLGFIC